VVPLGFTVMTRDFIDRSKRQLGFIQGLFGNVAFLGKANASFFSSDILKDTYDMLEEIISHG
jgi:hypothetical protein